MSILGFVTDAEKNSGKHLREYAEKNPEAKEVLLKKASDREETYKLLSVEKNFMDVLNEVHTILDEIEAELKKHTGGKCSKNFL